MKTETNTKTTNELPSPSGRVQRLVRPSTLPLCQCGKLPQWRFKDQIDDEYIDRSMWIECPCGMRTKSVSCAYRKNQKKDELLKIWKPNVKLNR